MRSLESLRAKTITDPLTGCWLWRGGMRANGYGVIGGEAAHRVAYRAAFGNFPRELLACHRCDVRNCINPDHIFLGTHGDNARDMASKGRQVFQVRPELAARGDRNGSRTHPERRPRGARQHLAKLDGDVVAAMRATVRCGAFSARQWSKWLGVSYSTTKRAISGRTWAHLACLLVLAICPQSFAQGRFDRFCSRTAQGRSERGFNCSNADDSIYFEFAPTSGAGMGTACACTTVTGAKGEAVTLTRASSATCFKKGLATTGIENGDAVLCATNQPRSEAQSSGELGLRVESARTNALLYSQDFTNAVWQAVVGGTSSPVVTANYGVAPDGTTTAERVEFPACAAGDSYSLLQQDYTGTAVAWAGALYLKGTSGSGTVSVYYYDNVAGAGTGLQCAFNATTWSRCEVRHTWANTGHRFGFGCNNLSVITNFGNTGAADVLVWQGDSQLGAHITSPIPTTTAAATRAFDNPVPVLTPAPFGATSAAGGCMAVTAQCSNTANGRFITYNATGGTLIWDANYGASTASSFWFIGSGTTFNSTLPRDTSLNRWVMSTGASGSLFSICKNGTCQTGSARGGNTSGNTAATIHIGNYTGSGNSCDGIISRVQVDPDPSRCL